jgi:DNA repair protein RecO (recombination protein O)
MLPLPAFLREDGHEELDATHLAEAFALTGFFLERHVLEPRGLAMLDARASFIGAVLRTTSAVRAAS